MRCGAQKDMDTCIVSQPFERPIACNLSAMMYGPAGPDRCEGFYSGPAIAL